MGRETIDAGAWYRPAHLRLDMYDEQWPSLYSAEADHIADMIGDDLVAIEQVGSTAIAGMTAKPIIDILAAVSSWDRFDRMVLNLRAVGYVYTPESEADDPGRRVFRKGPDDMSLLRTHHLHVTEDDSRYWRRIIAFRDQLREDPDDAAAYVQLKRALASTFANDSRGYSRGKHEFVTAIERKRGVIA